MFKPLKVHTIWTVTDSHWCCTLCECIYKDSHSWIKCVCPDCCLAEYLWNYGFDIPECVTYCLAQSDWANLKYRVFGNKIHIYLELC